MNRSTSLPRRQIQALSRFLLRPSRIERFDEEPVDDQLDHRPYWKRRRGRISELSQGKLPFP